ncbi:MAG: glycosyltransferase, partial [Ignavibacteria bacterium]|nr:glycosyltransferase [Ignavibacteria bacterium]
MHYLDHENKVVLIKTLAKVFPLRALINLRNRRVTYTDNKYNGELISIFIVTCNRLEFLKKCLTSLLNTIKEINHEIIIWDNASNDGTAEYLESIKDDKIQIIRSEKNIGTGAKAEAAALCKGDFIVGIDDDVLKFPQDWLLKMISAYKSVPRIGYLATDVIQNEHTTGAKPSEQHYVNKKFGDFVIQFGPAGGWCFVISREVFRKIGNFRNLKNRIFFSEDGDYINRLKRKGYRFGILKDVKVFHATGEFYNRDYKELYKAKMEDYNLNKAEKYHRQLNLRRILDIRGMLNSFLDFAERNLPEVKNEN